MNRKLAASILVICCHLTSALTADERLDRIFEIWKRREEAVQSARIEFDEHLLIEKGALTGTVNVLIPNPRLNGGTFPSDDMKIKRKCRMLLDGESFLERRMGSFFDNTGGTFRFGVRGLSSNGKGVRSLHHPSVERLGDQTEGDPRSVAFIYKEPTQESFQNYHFFPMTWTYRMLNPVMAGLDYRKLKFDRIDRIADEQECLVLKLDHPAFHRPDRAYTVWVSNDDQAAIRRHELIVDGKTQAQLDVDYETTGDSLLVPNKWSLLRTPSGGTAKELNTMTATRVELNVQFLQEELELKFPVGTHVHDRIDKTEYLILGDDTRRIISPEERGIRHSILLKTKTGEAIKKADPEEDIDCLKE